MANHTLGTIRGTIEIDYDGAGVVKATKDTQKLKDDSDKLGKASSNVLSGFGKFGKSAATVGVAIAGVSHSATILVGTLSALGPLAAAGFAAAPAAILSYKAAITVAKVATMGMGDALSAAGEDSKKFEEAIKDLSPQAQKFAKAFRSSLPALKSIKNAIQDAFFKGAAGEVKGVVDQISLLKPEASQVSRTMGVMAKELAKTATSEKNIGALKTILKGVNDFLKAIGTSLGPVLSGFLALGKQGASFGTILGEAVGDALASLAKWLSSIDLKSVFAEAMPFIRAIGQLLGDVAVIAKQLFSIFLGEGSDTAGIIGNLASSMADFLTSAQGQEAITALRDAMASITGSVGQVFLSLLQALAPILVAIAPGFAELASQISGVLVPALDVAGPLLEDIATFLSDNMDWLGPVAGAVVTAAAAYKTYAAAAALVSGVQTALNSKMAVATGFWIRQTASVIASNVAMAANAVVTGGAAVAAWIANTAAVIANRIATVAATVAMGIVRAATVAWTAAQWLLNAAISANPIGLFLVGLAALAAALIYAWNNSETFRQVVTNAWNAVKAAGQQLWNFLVTAFNAITAGISAAANTVKAVLVAVWSAIASTVKSLVTSMQAAITAAFNAVKSVVTSVMNSVKNVVSSIWNAIVSIVRGAINGVKAAINGVSTVVATVRGHFNRAKEAISTALTAAVNFVKTIPSKVVNAFGNVGSLLYEKGKSLISGFVDGIKAMARDAVNAAKDIIGDIADYLPGSPAKKGPLAGKGYVYLRAQRFMGDLAGGMVSKIKAPTAAAKKTATAVSGAAELKKWLTQMRNPTTSYNMSRLATRTGVQRYTSAQLIEAARAGKSTASTSSTAASTSASSTSGTRTYSINIGSTKFATLVLDTVSGNPVTVAKAANEGNRKTAWAGSGRTTKKTGKLAPAVKNLVKR